MNTNKQFYADCSTQLATLQGIAPLCPAQYGPAVYSARAMLSFIDTTMYVNDCELMPDSSSRDFHKPSHHDNPSSNPAALSPIVNVYPNPANTELNIEIIPTLPNQGINDYVYIYDNIGQLVEENILTRGLTTLSLSNYAVGIYFYRIVDNNQKALKTDKLLIIR